MSAAAAAIAWIAFAWVLGPHLVRAAYRGESLPFLNQLIAARDAHSLDEYLARWRVFAWSGTGAVLSAGALFLLAAHRWPGWLSRAGPPACAFLLARSLLWVGFAAAPVQSIHGHRVDGSPARPATSFELQAWSRWDSHVYLAIASRGYELAPCDIPWEGAPIARAGMWCGDTPWFPGYPALIWLLALFGIPELAGGVFVSATFCLATLLLVWTGFLEARPTAKNFLVLLFAALFPGAIYFHAVYPISMVTFFMLLSLHLVVRGKWVLGGIAGAAAAFTYPGAVFLAPVLAACVLFGFRDLSWPRRLWRSGVAGVMAAGGVALVGVVQAPFVGAWDAFFRTQAQYDVGSRMPVLTVRPVLARLEQLAHTDWAHAELRHWIALIVAVGTMFVTVIAVLSLLFAVRAARRSQASPPVSSGPMLCLGIFLLVFWLVPLALPHYSLIRRQSLLLPAVPLAQVLPVWVLGALAGIAALLVPILGALYFNGTLV